MKEGWQGECARVCELEADGERGKEKESFECILGAAIFPRSPLPLRMHTKPLRVNYSYKLSLNPLSCMYVCTLITSSWRCAEACAQVLLRRLCLLRVQHTHSISHCLALTHAFDPPLTVKASAIINCSFTLWLLSFPTPHLVLPGQPRL